MTATAPTGSNERIGELDVLRGFALLGVFIVHFVGGAFYMLSVEESWQEAQRALPLQYSALLFSDMFFLDKANTLFATLFGMGFWLMLDRLKSRGAAFERIYLRRLLILLAIGLVNVLFIFPGDVLHVYAMLGIVLMALHKMPQRMMLVIGVFLGVVGYFIADALVPAAEQADAYYETIQAAAFERGGYWHWVTEASRGWAVSQFIYGGIVGWALYLFGRFLIGAWIMRTGWISQLEQLLPQIRTAAWIALPTGLALSALGTALYEEAISAPEIVKEAVHLLAIPFHAAGYACALILLFHSRFKPIVMIFAPVGRMALSAYIAHGAIFTGIYMPFGLAMRGVLGPAPSLALVLVLFAVITLACHWWLGRYRYGPLEYLWRWATYGERPKFVLAPRPAAA
ncbi:MAG: DUF418 domain-containing protein [Pseudomonadota bacterium]